MRTPQAHEAKARISTFLAQVRASKESEIRTCKDADPMPSTTIRYRRMAAQEQRA